MTYVNHSIHQTPNRFENPSVGGPMHLKGKLLTEKFELYFDFDWLYGLFWFRPATCEFFADVGHNEWQE